MRGFNSQYIYWLTSNSRGSFLYEGRDNVWVGNAGLFPFLYATENLYFFLIRPNNVLCRMNLMKYLFLNLAKPSHVVRVVAGFMRTNMKGVDQRKTPLDELALAHTLNRLPPNDTYMGRTAPLTSKRCILYIYSTNIGTEYFKHALYSPFFLFKMQFVS